MTIAVYYSQDEIPSGAADYRLTLLDSVAASTTEKVFVLAEGPELASSIQKDVSRLKKPIHVLNVYHEAFQGQANPQALKRYPELDNHLWAPVFQRTSLLRNKYTFDHAVNALLSYFETLVDREGIRGAQLGDLHAFHSLGILLFDKVLAKKGIPRVMPFLSPVQGRHVLFDNLTMEIPGLEDRYNTLLRTGLTSADKADVDRYLTRYNRFVSTEVRQMFAAAREAKQKPAGRLKEWKRQLKLAVTQGLDLNPPLKTPDVSKPYVLLLLSKGENWVTNYAMPQFTDICHVATCLWKALPSDWSLIVKDHPLLTRQEQRRDLARLSRTMPNFFYVVDQLESPELIKGAQAVAFLGSRSGIDALMQFKHVIVFGNKPLYFSFKNAPVHQVTDVETLPEVYRQCAEAPPPADPVYAYFKAVLELSENHFGETDPHVIRMERTEDYFQRVGGLVVKALGKRTPVAVYG